MPTARTLKNHKYRDHAGGLTNAMASGEARGLFVAIGRNGETVDSMRELIRLDEESRKILTDFAAAQPEESVWVLRALEFRERVLEQFERLVLQSQLRP